jgi:hypothetical protein
MRTDSTQHGTRLFVETSRDRQTPPPAGRRFRDALATGAGAALRGIESVAGVVPGGSVVSAALRATSGARGSTTATGDALGTASDSPMDLLQLQKQIGDEQLRTTTLSNVLKARHEGARSVAQNIR